MNLLFDSRWIGDHGIGRFSREIFKHLNLEELQIKGNPASPLDPLRLMLTILSRTSRNTIVFSPGYNAPLFLFRPYVFTIMDLNHIDCLENSGFLKRLYYRYIMRPAARKALRVLTISEFSRQRIIDWAHIHPQKVVNVSCGVDSSYHPNVELYNPGYPYLLCVSNRKAHKNETRLIAAFSQAAINKNIHLVFTGQTNMTLQNLSRQYDMEDRVVFLGRVPEPDLPSLYRGATALVFPSLYEGFGLPPLEAMACGTPVIVSNTTSLPEVVGDAGLYVDPLDIGSIANAIKKIVCDEELQEILRKKGLARAKLFSWEKTAEHVRKVLSDAAERI